MERTIYGVNRYYLASFKIIANTEWFFNLDEAQFATTQENTSKNIIVATYHDERENPWIELPENTKIM